MVSNFHNVLLPAFLNPYIHTSISYHNRIITNIAGQEQRRAISDLPRMKYSIHDCYLNNERFVELNNFFRARQGSLYSFRFRDKLDYKMDNVIGIGDGNCKIFPIIKTYGAMNGVGTKAILYPHHDTIAVTVGADAESIYQLSDEGGKIIFHEAPKAGDEISVKAEFDSVVRFMHDELAYNISDNGSLLIEKLLMSEVVR